MTDGREAQDRFLFRATVELFEEFGFERVRQVGMHAWIVNKTVARLDRPPIAAQSMPERSVRARWAAVGSQGGVRSL